jgi:hypothetical protein
MNEPPASQRWTPSELPRLPRVALRTDLVRGPRRVRVARE